MDVGNGVERLSPQGRRPPSQQGRRQCGQQGVRHHHDQQQVQHLLQYHQELRQAKYDQQQEQHQLYHHLHSLPI